MAECSNCGATFDHHRGECPACGASSSPAQDGATGGSHESADSPKAAANPSDAGPEDSGEPEERKEADGWITRRRALLAGGGGIAALGLASWFVYPKLFGDETREWRTFRATPARTGHVSAEQGPGESLDVAWETDFWQLLEELEDTSVGYEDDDRHFVGPSSPVSSPVLDDGRVIFSFPYQLIPHGDGEDIRKVCLIALESTTGEIEWSQLFPTTLTVRRTYAPSIVDGLVFQLTPVPDSSETLEMTLVDSADGSIQREFGIGDQVYHSPVVEDGIVYTRPTADGSAELSHRDREDGSTEWSLSIQDSTGTSGFPYHPLTKREGTVYYFSRHGDQRELVAVGSDGTELWRQNYDLDQDPILRTEEPLAPPVVTDDRGFTAGGFRLWSQGSAGELLAFDPDSGEENWRFRPDGVTPHHIVGPNAPEATLEAMDPHGGVYGFPLVLDDTVIVSGIGKPAAESSADPNDRYLYGVSESDGSLEWSAPGAKAFAPVAAGNVVYARTAESRNSDLIAVSTDGDELDSTTLPYAPGTDRSLAIGSERLFVTGVEGIIALE